MPQIGYLLTQTLTQFFNGYAEAELLGRVVSANFPSIFARLRMEPRSQIYLASILPLTSDSIPSHSRQMLYH